MGKRDDSGSSNQAGSPRVTGEKKPRAKRSRSGAAEYARELNKNDNTAQLEKLHAYMWESFGTKKPAIYRLFYIDGKEITIKLYKDGVWRATLADDPQKKHYKKCDINLKHIKYISKASGDKFIDSLGFETGKGDERAEKIFAKEKKFKTYNEEVRKIMKRKKRKSSGKKKSSSKKGSS